MKIVILAPGGGYDASALPMIPTDSQVSVLGFESSPEVVGTVVPLQRPGGWRAKLTAAAARTMLGRVLLRLTPLDPGVVYWRATQASDVARKAIRDADLLVASERDAAYAAWRWHRAHAKVGRQVGSVFGYPAARAAIERASA
ncbi:hypothetical protein JF550_06970 [Microbacterium esteraromaticum]|uniref:Uncharacterized protein n=1 Tax=Microbacterium esteraromaticum TaxID=57043 RepID=A0A939DX93_9MICO|nr:hypothetical protein [Microbacterium esteraromaticum]MBN8205698.1 hypothetical protein [Microbacterium esteraromaticum]MBN8415852.1 hypothetical protein [Microbacterium esteraromaticum]